jgi:hypothetical protein
MISNDKIFFESLLLMMKELAKENCKLEQNSEESDLNEVVNHIHHTWIEMKPEFITLVSRTLNK